MSDLTWNEGLENVRMAYRVVAAYQQRVLSMLKIACKEFEPLDFAVWFPTEHDTPPQRATDLRRRWAWDFLPLNVFAVCLNTAGNRRWTVRRGDVVVFLYFCADWGFVDHTRLISYSSEPDPVRLPPVKDGESYFSIFAYRWEGDDREVDCYHDLWNTDDIEGADEAAVLDDKGDYSLFYTEISLSELETQDGFVEAVRGFKNRLLTEFGSI